MKLRETRRLKMADIAKIAGVSVSTISRALAKSPLIPLPERERIQKIADEHGYVINSAAQNLRLKSTRTIGLVLPLGHEKEQKITDPFFKELITSLAEEVMARGYDLLFSRDPQPGPDWLNHLVQSQRFDAMLLLGQSNQHEAINQLGKNYLPLVVWGEHLPDQTYCSVGVDNVLGGYLATRHLFDRGRKSLIFLGPTEVPEAMARLKGFIKAHSEMGIVVKPSHILSSSFTYDRARAVMTSHLRAGLKFEGIFAASDVIAHGAMSALLEFGLNIPQDVSVIGYDNVPLASTTSPPLSSIHQDIGAGAHMMVTLLWQRLQGEQTASGLIPATLVVRGSS